MTHGFTRLFIKFFMPYLLIIIFMLGMTYGTFIVAFNITEENALKMQQSYIEQSKSVLDRRFREAIDASLQLHQTPMVKAFERHTRDSLNENYFPAYALHHDLSRLEFVNEIIENYYIFYKNSGMVANNHYADHYDRIPEDILSITGMPTEAYIETLYDQYYFTDILPARDYRIYTVATSAIPLMTTIGYDFEEPKAVILMLLNEDKLKENMAGFGNNVGGNFFIVDKNNQVITSLNADDSIIEDGYLLTDAVEADFITFEAPSEISGWRYILVQPSNEVFAQLLLMRSISWIVIGLIFLVGLVISLMSARYNSKPVHKLMNSHEQLTERVKNQMPYLRSNFLERWLKGNYEKIDDLVAVTKYLKTNYEGKQYCVAVIDYDEKINILEDDTEESLKTLQMKQLVLKDIVVDHVIGAEYIHDVDHDKLALIFIDEGEDEETFRAMISQELSKCLPLIIESGMEECHVGVGNITNTMSGVTTSANEALDAASASEEGHELRVIWYDQLDEDVHSYYYPAELESRLFNCTKAGESEVVEQLIREVVQKNVLDKTLPPHMMRVFIYDLWGTLAKIQEKTSSDKESVKRIIQSAFEAMEAMTDLEKLQYLKKIYLQVSDLNHAHREGRHTHIFDSINDYIEANYKDPDFCLPLVAEKFNLSYAYLSQTFKEYNGEGFINYLQRLRMAEAERLLTDTRLSVKDIVTACGYNSSNTFGKAFKRINGVSASVFREKHLSKV